MAMSKCVKRCVFYAPGMVAKAICDGCNQPLAEPWCERLTTGKGARHWHDECVPHSAKQATADALKTFGIDVGPLASPHETWKQKDNDTTQS